MELRNCARREFVLGLSGTGLLGCSRKISRASDVKKISVVIDTSHRVSSIPPDFIGLGYEISSVAEGNVLSANNDEYVRLVRDLSSDGVVRVGGDTSDDSSWSPNGRASSSPKSTVTNLACIESLGGFLRATGWRLIWGLNLGSADVASAINQAVAVAQASGDRLLCFQIGNEPDLFARNGHRSQGYSYENFHMEYLRFADALRRQLPNAPLAGPDVADASDWVSSFAHDEGGDITLLTAHYYRMHARDPAATIDSLVHTDPRFLSLTKQLSEASRSANVPYRFVELNSFSGGGKPDVSDTFASALWGLDLMFTLALAGGSGINWQTGRNQLGFVSSYSPIFQNDDGHIDVRPLYYAIKAFSSAAKGSLIDARNDAGAVNFTSYATYDGRGDLRVTLINKDISTTAVVDLKVPERFLSAEISRLCAPSVDAKSGVEFTEGGPNSGHEKHLTLEVGSLQVEVPSITAVVLKLRA